MRVSTVLKDSNGGEPFYASQDPHPVETGQIPEGKALFLSSGGPDINEEILAYLERNSGAKVYLAPGSKQVARGIPSEVLRRLHMLSCNAREAFQLASHLRESAVCGWTTVDSLNCFRDCGVPAVRITDGENGVFAYSEGEPHRAKNIRRDNPHLQEILDLLKQRGVSNENTRNYADRNGLGDTRLGSDLAAELLGEDLIDRLDFAALIATLHTYNPEPNIANFPNEVIQLARGLRDQL